MFGFGKKKKRTKKKGNGGWVSNTLIKEYGGIRKFKKRHGGSNYKKKGNGYSFSSF